MTQQLPSPSNYSITEHPLKLNSSSLCIVSPQSSNFGSSLKNNLLLFEQYNYQEINNIQIDTIHQKNPKDVQLTNVGKKKLTILINENQQHEKNINREDDSNTFNQNQNQCTQTINRQIYNCFEFEINHQDKTHKSKNYLTDNPSTITYSSLLSTNKQLQKQSTQAKQTITNLTTQLHLQLQHTKHLTQTNTNLNKQLEQKNIYIQHLSSKIKIQQHQYTELKILLDDSNKNKQIQRENQEIDKRQFENICKQKDNKIKQINKINEKLKNLNRQLIKQIKNHQKKIRDLQKQIQNNLCTTTQDTIHRLKQSSIKTKQKQNIQRCNGTSITHLSHIHTIKQQKQKQPYFTTTQSTIGSRKSLQRKKNNNQSNTTSAGQLTQSKKNGKMTISMSSNSIISKKLIHK